MSFRRTVNDVRFYLASVGLSTRGRKFRVRAGRAEDCWGFWSPTIGIVVNPDLKGAALWRVLLHEFGHAFGLDHTRTGLMRSRPIAGLEHEGDLPTHVQRKRWVMQLARRVLEKRGKTCGAK